MNEYDLKKALAKRSEQSKNNPVKQSINGIPNSVLNDVFAGKRRATGEMIGHRTDLAPSVLAKMSQAFGMDFSGVQVYRSDAMAGTGMGGMAQGNKVVIGSDVDLNTQRGQALLGHEFSHIRAQSMGIGTGSGLLQDAGLEHQADNEGLLAAQGRNIHGESMGMSMGLGMAGFEGLVPLGTGLSATAAAPMQAWFSPFQKRYKGDDSYKNEVGDLSKSLNSEFNYDSMQPTIDQIAWKPDKDDQVRGSSPENSEKFKYTPGRFDRLIAPKEKDPKKIQKVKDAYNHNINFAGKQFQETETDDQKNDKKKTVFGNEIGGLNVKRIGLTLNCGVGSDFSDKYLKKMFENLQYGVGKKDIDDEAQYNEKHLAGAKMYKEVLYHELQKIEKKYGSVLHQMHPGQISEKMGLKELTLISSFNQDMEQLSQKSNGKVLNKALEFDDEKREADFIRLKTAYDQVLQRQKNYDEAVKLSNLTSGNEDVYKYAAGAAAKNEKEMINGKASSLVKNGPSLTTNEQQENKFLGNNGKYFDHMKYKDLL